VRFTTAPSHDRVVTCSRTSSASAPAPHPHLADQRQARQLDKAQPRAAVISGHAVSAWSVRLGQRTRPTLYEIARLGYKPDLRHHQRHGRPSHPLGGSLCVSWERGIGQCDRIATRRADRRARIIVTVSRAVDEQALVGQASSGLYDRTWEKLARPGPPRCSRRPGPCGLRCISSMSGRIDASDQRQMWAPQARRRLLKSTP
jgi:hypothetical protein